MSSHQRSAPGPLRVDQVAIGDRYELDNGHLVYVQPTGGDGARGTIIGGQALASDPKVEAAGLDAGFALSDDVLRAPDVAIGRIPDAPGWIPGAPELAVEYSSTGQDEQELQKKIRQLLAAGTRFVWVVRLIGPRRVEVHEKDRATVGIASPGELLEAPGVLQNPVPVEALYDPHVANDVTLRNLLQRKGYENLDAVRAEGEAKGRAEGEAKGRAEGEAKGRAEGEYQGRLQAQRDLLHTLLGKRGIRLTPAEETRIAACQETSILQRWLDRAWTAQTATTVLND